MKEKINTIISCTFTNVNNMVNILKEFFISIWDKSKEQKAAFVQSHICLDKSNATQYLEKGNANLVDSSLKVL